MGIPCGVTLIVGGGFHGKSTLLSAIEVGIYDKVAGDGREFVAVDPSAVKIRAEDGRSVQNLNIAAFINNLPNLKSTENFTTENASGSTSQAANIIESCEMGTRLLLLDEDSCATNFMSRDSLMAKLVGAEREPITTFLERVRELYDVYGISSILVVGGCGEYFGVADTVICMDSYTVTNVTDRAKAIFAEVRGGEQYSSRSSSSSSSSRSSSSPAGTPPSPETGHFWQNVYSRRGADTRSLSIRQHGKIYVRDIAAIKCGGEDVELTIDVTAVEQLVEVGQLRAIAEIMELLSTKRYSSSSSDSKSIRELVDEVDAEIERNGMGALIDPSNHIFHGKLTRPRRFEIAAAINRWRKLKCTYE
jgi:Predicted ATPase of the ABC class